MRQARLHKAGTPITSASLSRPIGGQPITRLFKYEDYPLSGLHPNIFGAYSYYESVMHSVPSLKYTPQDWEECGDDGALASTMPWSA